MDKNKWCCRIFPIVLIVISAVIATALWYFEEGNNELSMFKSWSEFINYLGTVLVISILPIGLFYWLNDKEKYREKAKLFALFGFLPAILFAVFIIA